ncbi:MAG: DUF4176 domain-containing protein [Bacilli bacterium]|nr:DUF4176 domain-containing protein [Bacilli bacterium]
MDNEYLPIGSVVMLNGGKKRLMVIGFCSMANGDDNTIYDYSGCLYPEGLLNSNEVFLFNNSQIEEIFFRGLDDEEEKIFKENLSNNMNGVEQDTFIKIEDAIVEKDDTPTFSINDGIFN